MRLHFRFRKTDHPSRPHASNSTDSSSSGDRPERLIKPDVDTFVEHRGVALLQTAVILLVCGAAAAMIAAAARRRMPYFELPRSTIDYPCALKRAATKESV